MAHRVFISHSTADRDVANAICHNLEEAGIRCWIAPRDIENSDWAGSIMRGLQSCDVFVVVISHHSILSGEVTKEVTEATRVCQYILPFKVDDEMLSDRLRYHLAPCHWLDAVCPPLQAHIEKLKYRLLHLGEADDLYINQSRQRVIGHNIKPSSLFLGRQQELEEIHSMLHQTPVLFLQGMGGIGKSEIAKGYARHYADSFDKVLFANYRGSILDMIIGEDIQIENLHRNSAYGQDTESSEAFFRRKLNALMADTSSRTLLIVDNFDVDYDEHLEDLLCGSYKVLLTTRMEHFDYPCLPIGPIHDFETVRQLFIRNYGRRIPEKEMAVVDEILKLVDYHTITVELIARQTRVSMIPLTKMLQTLKESGTNAGLRETVRRGSGSRSAFDFISELFSMSALNSQEQHIMRCMCMVPFEGIDVQVLRDCLDLEDMGVIYDLTAKSWLILDEETFRIKMHPVICDVAKQQLKPDPSNCHSYIVGIHKYMGNAWFVPAAERNEKWPYIAHILKNYPTPSPELYTQYTEFANTAWICGQFEQSIESAKHLYAYTLEQYGDAGYKPAFAARTVAGAYFNAGDEASAVPYYRLCLEHIRKKPEERYKELAWAYQKLGRCAYNAGDFAQAQEYLNRSLEAFDIAAQIPAENVTVNVPADSYVELARMHMAQGQYEQALGYSQIAYDKLYAWQNREVTSSAYCLCDMGICYSHLGDYEKANAYLSRALELNIHFSGEVSLVTARTKEHIADNLARQGRKEEAIHTYVELILDMEKNFGSTCPQVLRLQKKEQALLAT